MSYHTINKTRFMGLFFLASLLLTFACAKEEIIVDQEDPDGIENPTDETGDGDQSDGNPNTDDTVSTELKAFPLAEGAAYNVTGGRGGKVIHVTNLNDSGPGSFREALFTKGPRTIVFDVSGTIEMQDGIYVYGPDYGNVTIAGQTAPKGGITLKGHYTYFERVDNIIMRYIRFRMDRDNGGLALSTLVTSSCKDVIFDHLSISYGRDENLTIWDNAKTKGGNHTVQYCIVADGKNNIVLGASDTNGRSNYAGDVTLAKNLISYGHRTPNTSGNARFDVYNNFVYNWQFRLSAVGDANKINHINNFYRMGKVTEQFISGDGSNSLDYFNNIVLPFNNGKIYTEGNVYEGMAFMNKDNWNAWRIFGNTSKQLDESIGRSQSPLAGLGISDIWDTDRVSTELLKDIGANKFLNEDGSVETYVDSNDEQYLEDALNSNDRISVNQVGYYQLRWYANNPYLQLPFPNLPTKTRPDGYDSDQDGMPDTWEKAMGLNPNIKDHNGDKDGDGYTNLEEFINLVDKQN
ncbi:MAG: hypothetical protein OIF50_01250 [Flavobacteriaceae bacterium]|nr:hypothetical protein [Flavobacteriaceae bacterium]